MSDSAKKRGEIVRLRGRARDYLVLVLHVPVNKRVSRRGGGVDVEVAPIWRDVDRATATTWDVLCPPDAATGLGDTVAVAAWAAATIPAVCLGETIGRIDDSAVLEAVRDVRLALVDNHVKPPVGLVGLIDPETGNLPAWHQQLKEALGPYWDGTAADECQPSLAGHHDWVEHTGEWFTVGENPMTCTFLVFLGDEGKAIVEAQLFGESEIESSEAVLDPVAYQSLYHAVQGSGFLATIRVNDEYEKQTTYWDTSSWLGHVARTQRLLRAAKTDLGQWAVAQHKTALPRVTAHRAFVTFCQAHGSPFQLQSRYRPERSPGRATSVIA